MEERFFITGVTGCIGAWTARRLVREGVFTSALVRGGSTHRLSLIMEDDEVSRIRLIRGDITDADAVGRALEENGITHVIHLAAMQFPFCKADPSLGAAVNVQGTVNVFEAAKKCGIDHLVYASSTAVYGPAADYPPGPLAHDAPLSPRSHYGVYKQANEGTARVYWQDDRISSIGIRPYVVYGPGRDQGLTSGPTKAMLAAAAGLPYHVPFGGRFGFQYADDTAPTSSTSGERRSRSTRSSPPSSRPSPRAGQRSPTTRTRSPSPNRSTTGRSSRSWAALP
jgi:UDP-glucuronate 4-epimerase